MKKILSVLLMVCILTVSFVNTVMADETVGWTFEADATEVNIGDTVIVTLSNDDAMAINAGYIFGLTFNDNFELLECDDAEENYTGFDGPTYKKGKNYLPYFDVSNTKLDATGNGEVGDTSFLATGYNSVEVEAGDITITYVLKATTAGVVEINATNPNNRMQRFDDTINDAVDVPISITPVTVTVKGAEPPAPTTYTVTYNAGEGSNAPAADTNVVADTVIDLTKKAEPTAPSGKQFKGWSENGTDIITSLTVTGDVTLTALYEEIPVPTGPVLNGVATRLASSVTIDNVNHTVNVVYDTEQQVYPSGYVCFAPVVDDGVTVTYDSYADFSSTRSRLVNYTVTSTFGSTQFIDLLAEKNTAKPAIIGNSLYKADKTGVHNFNMTLEDGNGATATYAVTLTIGDSKVQANNLLEGITAADFITERESDEVAIDTSNKVITLTTKNMYNYTTIAIDATKVGKDAIDTFALRPRRTMQLLDADSNAKYMGFRNEEVYNKYDRAILLYYGNGTTRSYTVRIYGGADGLSYEDYTLTVVYAPTFNVENMKIGRIQIIANAKANKSTEINDTGKIQLTYDPTKSNIVFSPIYARGYEPYISGDEGKVVTEQQTIAGALRDVYTITTDNIPSALKYNIRHIRDIRTYDVEFLNKNN